MSDKTPAQEWTEGYDLDGGGYKFEPNSTESAECLIKAGMNEDAKCCLAWDSPDLDYIIGQDCLPRNKWGHRETPDLLLICPNDGHYPETTFPESFEEDDYKYVCLAQGWLAESDHDCNCHGHLAPWTGAAGEPREPLDSLCNRCDGDGYENSPSGNWAVYSRETEEGMK